MFHGFCLALHKLDSLKVKSQSHSPSMPVRRLRVGIALEKSN